MYDFENMTDISSDFSENLSNLVGDTPIEGFEQLADGGNEDIADYLRDTIPEWHFDGCTKIEYAPDSSTFKIHDSALGVFYPKNRNIEIASMERFETVGDMIDTVVHETGHNVHENLLENNKDAAEKWEELYRRSISEENSIFGFVSDYAKTSVYEDFAESYKTYVRDPELLKFMNEEKYEFMKTYVFEGKEYLKTAYAVSYDIPSSHLDGMLDDKGTDKGKGESTDSLGTLAYEDFIDSVGRNLYSTFVIYTPEIEKKFIEVTAGAGNESVFAEMYNDYISNSDELLASNPQQYEFMKEYIFNGVEYSGAQKLGVEDDAYEVSSTTIEECEQLDIIGMCNQLDIVAVSEKKKYGVDEKLNPLNNDDEARLLCGCEKKCVNCDVKTGDCGTY